MTNCQIATCLLSSWRVNAASCSSTCFCLFWNSRNESSCDWSSSFSAVTPSILGRDKMFCNFALLTLVHNFEILNFVEVCSTNTKLRTFSRGKRFRSPAAPGGPAWCLQEHFRVFLFRLSALQSCPHYLRALRAWSIATRNCDFKWLRTY